MSGGRGPQVQAPGHHIYLDHAALNADGTVAAQPAAGRPGRQAVGHAGCSCGVVSIVPLSSKAARERWWTRHRDHHARAPWSDNSALEVQHG